MILSYSENSKYKLLDWMDEKKLDWRYLLANSHSGAINFLKKNMNKIVWFYISSNFTIFEINHKETYKHIFKIANNICNKN